MHRSLFLLLLIFVSRPAFSQNDPSCEAKTDTSTSETTITCDNQSVDVLKQPNENIFHAVVALSRTGDEDNALSLVTGSSTSHFTAVDTATALIDGERHTFEASYTNGNTKAGVAIEQVVVVLPREHTNAIRTAESFWIRLQDAVFDLGPTIAQMKRIHEMKSKGASSP